MADEEVIVIDDDEDIILEDGNLMAFENLLDDSSDEDRVLSEDSDYNSDCSIDIITDIKQRTLNRVEINSLGAVKMCCIYFYYKSDVNEKFCTDCFMRISDLFSNIRVVREHESAIFDLILGSFCAECRKPLYQIMPCNMCPICIV